VTTPTGTSPTDRNPRFDETAVAALQNALAAEHAAIWCYALAVAFLSGTDATRAREDENAHRELRGQVEQTLTQLGAPAVSAQPAYATPTPVTDAPSAARLAIVAETDALAAWRSVVERAEDRDLRQAALDALSAGTLRCSRWRAATGQTPTIPVFPGQPDTPR
jgi:hypothetical protein